MTETTVFVPTSVGAISLANRIVMALVTRNRAGAGFVPGNLTAEYYAKRASAALIMSEAPKFCSSGRAIRIR